MHVLQAALLVVGHVEPQIFFIFRVPERGHLIRRDLAVDEGLFQLVADHDVDAVGQLVRVHTVQARTRYVDRLVQLPVGHVGEGIAGQLPQLRRDEAQERLAPADDVFKETGNALVHGAGHIVVGVIRVLLFRHILHEQRVSALVHGGEDVRDEIILIKMSRHADIVRSVMVGEGVLCGHQHQRRFAQPLKLQKIAGEPLLQRDRHRTGHEILADGLALLDDPLYKGQDPRLQGREERVQLRDGAAFFIVVQQRIVDRRFLLVPQGHRLAGVFDQQSEGIPEQGKILRFFRAQPVAVGAVLRHVHLISQLRGNILFPGVVFIKMPDGALLRGGEPFAVLVQLGKQGYIFLRVGELVDLLAEDRHIVPRLSETLLRRAAFHIELHLADAALVRVDFIQKRVELFQFLFVCCHNATSCGFRPYSVEFSICIITHRFAVCKADFIVSEGRNIA